MSAKSSNLRTSSSTEGEFLHELEEKLEVLSLLTHYMMYDSWELKGNLGCQ